MKRRFYPLLLALLVLLLIPGWAAAASSATEEAVNLMIGGQAVTPDVPPVIKSGRTLVPVRVIAEGLGADVAWNEAKRTAVITRGTTQLSLTLDSRTALLNGKQVKLDTPPVISQQRMLLPLRFVGESLGITVGWDNSSRTVIANETPQVTLNGRAPEKAIKLYQVSDTMYVSADAVAEQVGQKGFVWNRPERGMTIDSQLVLPIEQVEDELGGSITWNKKKNLLEIERLNRLTGVTKDGDRVHIEMKLPVQANSFVLTGPHRIVLDLPQTALADDLVEELKKNEENGSIGESEERKQAASSGEEDEQSAASEPKEEPLIASLRYSQYSASPETVRVVIELNQKSEYNLAYTKDGIEVKLTPKPKKTGYLIVVDAGHGGKDPGALGVAGNHEKDYTLAVANKVVALLKQYPEFQVVPVRTTDVFYELSERVAIANELEADLFLSIHANSFPKPTTGGTETFYYNANSKTFAQLVHKHLQGATQFPDRGVKASGFYVIKNTKMPAVLTETGFLSNPQENALLTSPAFQDKIAKALVEAIREYYQSYQ
ncbi:MULTISPECIES: N-acetylmuramoyl-L-alanine amidase family protein [Brevibacillus]|uniref:N-acetylmuramoyl-L-alanine amidase family protein n=1 Tax=Brevibacillus TaxID=55080 RepID=UPI000271D441|nr:MULTISPECIES: N-acetylmuramoyl-L-alanine amidase family protein [Brevibacillus]EJL47542.1 N-acetylmuramoyl-L-alanine amidase [Brevibacillus sp. CF112]MED1822109.1 N-acetylmuramoyl-L-alanine amidase family protein [Brevibacillus agri]MED3501537.1 N-acetylmuramoyl-L-alanine amidase family protein [Brevibacillus agri]